MEKKTYNINDIASLAAGKSDYMVKNTLPISKAVFDSIAELLLDKKMVYIHNFGKFELKVAPERAVIHPATGEKVVIPSHYKIHFTALPKLKEKVFEIPVEE